MQQPNVAIVGATGMVGRTFVNILAERNFPVGELRLLASPRSAGTTMLFRGAEHTVEALDKHSFAGIDIALFSAGASISRDFAPIAADAGATVIDNSSCWRMHAEVPLIVPEVNANALEPHHRIIANPNCSTIQMVVALKPLHDLAGIQRVVASTYQAVSGKGKAAVDEMLQQSRQYLAGEEIEAKEFPHQIVYNALPHIDVFGDDGYTREEQKMVNETRKIMAEPDLRVSATCVRISVHTGHCVSANIEFAQPIDPAEARDALARFPGVRVLDEPANNIYPTPVDSANKDEVFVGRIRQDPSVEHGLNVWIVSDNLRKGAALNTIQIAELLVR